MKVENRVTWYVGPQETQNSDKNSPMGRRTVFAGNLNPNTTLQDRMEQRKAQAKEKALKCIGDVFSADKALDEDMESRRLHIRDLKQENLENQKEIRWYNEEQERLKEVYGVTDDSEEQKELELLRKCADSKGGATRQEREQADAIKKRGLTEYQSRQLEMDDAKKLHQEKIDKNDKLIEQENRTLEAMRLERLKKSPMVEAQKEAEKILQTAREDIINMTVEEGKNQIDEEAKEREEKAKEIKEEKEKQEELIEKRKEKRREEEELLEDMPVTEMLALDRKKSDVQQEVKDMLNQMKLVEEDIKGAVVDETL